MNDKLKQDTSQFLTFTLGKEIFALSISSVREVLELTSITGIPRTPKYMRGVINLRGHAVPVVDMRMKMELEAAEYTVNTCIIVVEVEYEGEKAIMGSLVDSVREVIELAPDKIESAPRIGSSVNSDYIKGMGRQGDDFIIILEIGNVFSAEELRSAKSASDSNLVQEEEIDIPLKGEEKSELHPSS